MLTKTKLPDRNLPAIRVDGRPPYDRLIRIDRCKVSAKRENGTIYVRIDHPDALDFWMELTLKDEGTAAK